jgi:hypothetical protein
MDSIGMGDDQAEISAFELVTTIPSKLKLTFFVLVGKASKQYSLNP